MRTSRLDRIPPCDLCQVVQTWPVLDAVYDALLTVGGWGYVCQPHFDQFAVAARTEKTGLATRIEKEER